MVENKLKIMKTVVKINIIFLCVIFQASACKKDEKLQLERKDYIGNELRIDGYYYYEYPDSLYNTACFLFRNGIFLAATSYKTSEIKEFEKQVLTEVWINSRRKSKDSWGVFNVKDSILTVERWAPPLGIGDNYKKAVYTGKIFNDTTFEMSDGIYHFKQFFPKPDSTNPYIK